VQLAGRASGGRIGDSVVRCEGIDLQTDFIASLKGIREGAIEGIGGGRVEGGPAVMKRIPGGGPVGEVMGHM
jgi:hypothetical protein